MFLFKCCSIGFVQCIIGLVQCIIDVYVHVLFSGLYAYRLCTLLCLYNALLCSKCKLLLNQIRALYIYWYALMLNFTVFFCAASKQPRLHIDEAVDDVLSIALAHKFRQRLATHKGAEASTSNQDAEKRKQRGKKVDHLHSRSTTEFIKCLIGLTPRQKEVVHELGFGAILHFNIKEILGYIAYWVLKTFNLARCEIPWIKYTNLAMVVV